MAYLLNRVVKVGVGALGIVSALVACSTGAPNGGGTPPAPVPETRAERGVQNLRQAFPGVRLDRKGTRLARVFGSKLTTGQTPIEAAERFRVDHGHSLGAEPDELEPEEIEDGKAVPTSSPKGIGLMYDPTTGQHRFTLYRYGQKRDGLRVYRAGLRTVVKNSVDNPVVWASSNVKDLRNFRPKSGVTPAVDRDKTLRAVRGATDFIGNPLPTPTTISKLSKPELVVFAGTEDRDSEPRLAMEYTADTDVESFEIVADAETGDILNLKRLIVFENVVGSVGGNVTQGFKAGQCAEEALTTFPFAEVNVMGGGSAFADVTGAFVLPNAGTTAVNVRSPVSGQYFDVADFSGQNELLSQTVVPPGPATFLHNPTNTEILQAQANAYANSNQVRGYLLNYLPNYPTISTQVDFPVLVNRTDFLCPGNAWYDFSSINFCLAQPPIFANTSFASVNHHEYGHHIVTSGGSGQDEYGEGMSDAIAALLSGDPGLGYGFFSDQCDAPLRTADNDCQYSATACSSCGGEVHDCGNLLSGAIWSVRELLAVSEPSTYVDTLNALVLSSIPMHTGGTIQPSIAVDLLTLDDDDGNIDNGTPHYDEICGGFQAHGMACPPLLTGLDVSPGTGLDAEGPIGGPFAPASISYTLSNLGPEPNLAYHVAPAAPATWLTISNATGSIPLGATAEVSVAIDQAQASLLARGVYSAAIQFVNDTSSTGTTSRTAELQVGVPSVVFEETFEGGLGGFTPGTEPFNAWHVTSACAAALPDHSAPNALYFGVDTTCNYQHAFDVLAGTAFSGPIAITDTSVLEISFNYLLGTEGNASFDQASVEVSVNGGEYVIVASNNGGGLELVDGDHTWHAAEIDAAPLLAGLTSANISLRFRFNSVDGILNAFDGFLVDDVRVRAFTAACVQNSECDDGAFCNGSEVCVLGHCAAGTSVSCGDGVPCTQDFCVEATDSCGHQLSDLACSDSNPCNGLETCSATLGCQTGTPPTCNDDNVCTTDSCDTTFGCFGLFIDCDDGNACTAEFCDAVTGCGSEPVTCDDVDACTTDTCDPGTGCGTTPVVCDDNNPCTNDSCDSAAGCVFTDNGSCSTGPFIESGGQVVMESEHFSTTIPRAGHSWTPTNNGPASGGQVMVATPNNGAVINTGYTTGSPQLNYPVLFTTTGTYHVWIRGSGPNADGDSLHAGIDGTGPSSADRISTFGTSLGWSKATMDGPVATIVVTSAGVHNINVWMREDGMVIDKILLTTNANFTPSGGGPAESPHAKSCTNASQCSDSNACTNDVCSNGFCSNPPNGSCGPCQNICSNPINFTVGNPGNLGTGAACYQTTANLQGGNCGNFVSPRTLSVNGSQRPCNNQNWTSLPPKVNGGYCISTTAGNHPWAYFSTW